MAVQRIHLLGVPVDICRPEDLEPAILELLAKPGTKQIVFLSLWNLLKARKQNDYAECVRNADLVLPVSKSILKGARYLKLAVPVRYNPFTAVISILSVLDSHYKSLYMLGSRKEMLQVAERNLHATFPRLQIVGRYVGYYSKYVEKDVVQAIYKSSPSLALLCDGIREKDSWVFHRRNQFSSSIFLYYRDAIGIFSERIKRVKESTFEHGNEIWVEILHNPFKIFLFFPYLHYNLLLLWTKIRNRKK